MPLPRRMRALASAAAPALLLAGLLGGCSEEYPQTTFQPVTEFGEIVNRVFANTFWWTIAILVIVEALVVFVIIRFREKPEDESSPKQIHGHTGLEIAWTIIPAIIVALITVPTVKAIFAVSREAPAEALTIEVIGHQWWWEFRYPELGIATANEIHIPVGRPVRLRMWSADVIHSFWPPRLAGKRDANPIPAGADSINPNVNELVFTAREAGSFPGACAEFCGLSHAHMRFMSIAHEPAEFQAWTAAMKEGDAAAAAGMPAPPQAPAAAAAAAPSPPAAASGEDARIAEGRRLFTSRACVACHSIQGTNARGVIGPNLTRFGARWSIGAGALENTPENLAAWIRHPQESKPGALMPGVRDGAAGMPPTNLSDDEVEAVAAYLSSLR